LQRRQITKVPSNGEAWHHIEFDSQIFEKSKKKKKKKKKKLLIYKKKKKKKKKKKRRLSFAKQ